MLFLSSATSIVLSGMLAYPVGEAVLGRRPSLGETWRRTRRMVPRLLRLCVVLVLPPTIVFGALIALVVWGFAGGLPALGVVGVLGVAVLTVAMVWVGTKVALATPALVLEDIGAIPALRRAWWLTTGLFWRTLGILLLSGVLIGIVQYVLSVVIQLGGMLLGLAARLDAGQQLCRRGDRHRHGGGQRARRLASGILTQPFLAAVTALLYTDSRIRREGFDLALARAAAADAGNAAGARWADALPAPFAVHLPVGVPARLDPDNGQARRWLTEELARPPYSEHNDPISRLLHAIKRAIDGLLTVDPSTSTALATAPSRGPSRPSWSPCCCSRCATCAARHGPGPRPPRCSAASA